ELAAREQRQMFAINGTAFRGRAVQLDLPVSISVGGKVVSSVKIHQGVNADALAQLAHQPLIDSILEEADTPWRETIGIIKIESDELRAGFRIGQFFASELSFLTV